MAANRKKPGGWWSESGFDAATHSDLVDGFLLHRPNDQSEAELFVQIIGQFGLALPSYKAVATPEQKKRVADLRSLGTAAAKAADIIKRLDTSALECVIYQAAEVEPYWTLDVLAFLRVLDEVRAELVGELSTLGSAAMKAAKVLPVDKSSPRLSTVDAIARQFSVFSLPFIASDSSYAAKCVRAVFAIGGEPVDDPRYWIRQAISAQRRAAPTQ